MATNRDRFLAGQQSQTNRERFLAGQAPQSHSIIPSEPITAADEFDSFTSDYLQRQVEEGNITEGQPGFWASLAESTIGEIPQTAGSIAAVRTGLPMLMQRTSGLHPALRGPAVAGGTILLAGIGGAGGKIAQAGFKNVQTGEHINFAQLQEDAYEAFVKEAAGEAFGGVLGQGVKLVGKGLKGAFPAAKGAAQAARIASDAGTVATGSQLTTNRLVNLFEGLSEKVSFGGGKLRATKTVAQGEAIKQSRDKLLNNFVDQVGQNLTPDEVGAVAMEAINGTSKAWKAGSKAMYRNLDNVLKRSGLDNQNVVDMRAIKRRANSIIKAKVRVGKSAEVVALAHRVSTIPDFMSFGGASGLRSALMQEVSEAARVGGSTQAKGLSKHFVRIADAQIEKAFKGVKKGPEVIEAWRAANGFYRAGKEQLNTKIVKKLASTLTENPERFVNTVFRKNAVDQVLKTRKAVGEKAWGAAKLGLMNDILQTASAASEEGIPKGAAILRALDDKLGPKVIQATFSDVEQRSIREFAQGVSALQRKASVPGTSSLFVGGAQIGAAGAALAGVLGPLIGILGGSKVVSKITLNPVWTKIALEGMQAPKGSGEAVRLVNLVRRIKKDQDKKDRKQQLSRFEQAGGFQIR